MPRAGGRPTKYLKKYCKLVQDLMGKGYSIASVAREIGVPRQRLYEWGRQNPEFQDALDCGRDACQDFYERISRSHATGQFKEHETYKNSNVASVHFILAKRFSDYHERKHIEVDQLNKDVVFTCTIGKEGFIGFDETEDNGETAGSARESKKDSDAEN